MNSSNKYNKSFQKKNDYYISPLKTVQEENEEKKFSKKDKFPNNHLNNLNYIKTLLKLKQKIYIINQISFLY